MNYTFHVVEHVRGAALAISKDAIASPTWPGAQCFTSTNRRIKLKDVTEVAVDSDERESRDLLAERRDIVDAIKARYAAPVKR